MINIFTQEQIQQFQEVCAQRGYVVWYGSAFRDEVGKIIQATEQKHRVKTVDITFVANICIQDDGTFKVHKIKGKGMEEVVDTWDKAILKFHEYLLMRK
jgi:hypothetical protein